MTDDVARPTPEEARAQLALSATTRPEVTRRDRVMVAVSIAGSGLAGAIYLVWLFPIQLAGDGHPALFIYLLFAVPLVGFNFLRSRVRTTPRDTQRLALIAAVLFVPAAVVGLLVAHLPFGPALVGDIVGTILIAAPSLVIARRVLQGSQ